MSIEPSKPADKEPRLPPDALDGRETGFSEVVQDVDREDQMVPRFHT